MHAAFVFKGGAILSWANNNSKCHAERKALFGIGNSNVNVLSVRIGKNGKLRNARPCKKCWKYMEELNVRIVFYSTDEGTIVRERV